MSSVLFFYKKTVANILRLRYNQIIKKVNHQIKRSEKMKVVMYGRYGVRYVVVHDVDYRTAYEIYMYVVNNTKDQYFVNLDIDSIAIVDRGGTVYRREYF